jgi:hypothetical protein
MEAKKQSLDLNAYGVEEMNDAEMRETDGGWVWLAYAAAAVTIVWGTLEITERVGYAVGLNRCTC